MPAAEKAANTAKLHRSLLPRRIPGVQIRECPLVGDPCPRSRTCLDPAVSRPIPLTLASTHGELHLFLHIVGQNLNRLRLAHHFLGYWALADLVHPGLQVLGQEEKL